MSSQDIMMGARVAHVRELKSEIERLRRENTRLRGESESLRAHFDLALLAAEDLRGLPPCYTYVGDIEPFYCETLDYVRRLREAGVEADVDVYPGWFHAYDLFFPAKKTVREAILRFEEHFRYAAGHYSAPQDEDGISDIHGRHP